ncbi:unnamed protein product [Calypogeia fissa]
MALRIILERGSIGEIANIPLDNDATSRYVSEMYIRQRFGLPNTNYVYRIRRKIDGFVVAFSFQDNIKLWKLSAGLTYFVDCRSDVEGPLFTSRPKLSESEKGKATVKEEIQDILPPAPSCNLGVDPAAHVVDLSSSSNGSLNVEEDMSPTKEESAFVSSPKPSSPVSSREWIYSISALKGFLHIFGSSELSKFRRDVRFDWKQVDSLPDVYGDTIFELPPVDLLQGRGKGL